MRAAARVFARFLAWLQLILGSAEAFRGERQGEKPIKKKEFGNALLKRGELLDRF